MTEDPYYTYNPEENTTPSRNNSKLFAGLLMGLLIGGVAGYILGSQNLPALASLDSGATPPFFFSINVAIILVLFVFLLASRIRRTNANPTSDRMKTRKLFILIFVVLLVAGIFVFYTS